MYEGSYFSASSLTLAIVCLFNHNYSHSNVYEMVGCSLDLMISLMIKEQLI